MLTKAKVKEQIESFPDKFTIDELIERLILLEKIEKGDKQSENGNIISEEEMNKRNQEMLRINWTIQAKDDLK